MKTKLERSSHSNSGVQELCRKLKLQLDDLGVAIDIESTALPAKEKSRRIALMEELKKQLAELSS